VPTVSLLSSHSCPTRLFRIRSLNASERFVYLCFLMCRSKSSSRWWSSDTPNRISFLRATSESHRSQKRSLPRDESQEPLRADSAARGGNLVVGTDWRRYLDSEIHWKTFYVTYHLSMR